MLPSRKLSAVMSCRLQHPFIAEAGLERTSISPSLVSSTYLPSVHSQQTPVLTKAVGEPAHEVLAFAV